MRFTLELKGVQTRGAERLKEPMSWPVYFVVDDRALRFLMGDTSAGDFVQAPGPVTEGGALRFEPTLQVKGPSKAHALVGVGLLYTAGGAKVDSTWEAYRDLSTHVVALALAHAAQATGLQALLSAFGGPPPSLDSGQADLTEKLVAGVDPSDLGTDLEALVQGVAAFRPVAQALGRVLPGAPKRLVPADVVTHATAVAAGLSAPLRSEAVTRLDPAVVAHLTARGVVTPTATRPTLDPRLAGRTISGLQAITPTLTRPTIPDIQPRPRFADLPDGSVVATTVQAWRADAVAADHPVSLSRALPARAALRASLLLSGSLRREG